MEIKIKIDKKPLLIGLTVIVVLLILLISQPLDIKPALAQAVPTPVLQNANKFNNSSLPNVLGTSTSVPYQNVNSDVNISGNVWISGATTNGSKLYLTLTDPNHYMYSTGTGGNQTYYGEWGGNFNWIDTSNNRNLLKISGSNTVASGELISTLNSGYGQFRMVGGNTGAMFRNDGANTYLLLTNPGDPYGSWNGLRPFYVDDNSGSITMLAPSVSVGNGSSQLCLNGSCITAWPASSTTPNLQAVTNVGNITSQRIGVAGQNPNNIPSGWGGGLNTWDMFAQASVRANSLCLGGGTSGTAAGDCRSAWPNGGVYSPNNELIEYAVIYNSNQCDGSAAFSIPQNFPNQIDAATALQSYTGGGSPSNSNVSIAGTNQVHVWSGVGGCTSRGANFPIMLLGH